ncbi:MAG: beta-lactamase family protein [Gemmatimonadaceae bacterium]|nr:beta-lactamase family protein [Gemmatimonadaceae bacterium]
MKRHAACLAGLASLLLSAAPRATVAQTAEPRDTADRAVDRLFEAWRDTTSPGCAVGVSRDGNPLLQRAYGMANLETGTPNRPGTIFHGASLAKQFTAMAVLLLVRDGKLSLDDDVRRFIPELPDYGTRITVRHLLGHTSGLRDFFELLILGRGRFEEDRITQADALDVITRQAALNFAPGSEYLYSNSGYMLAALVVQRVSGQPLRDFAAQRIFTPLGMSATRFQDDFTSLVPGRAAGYARRGTGWRSSMPNYDVYGPTNLLTTVGDLLRWSANLHDPHVGDTAIVRAMATTGVLADGDPSDYGLGLSIAKDRGVSVIEHEGSDPGFRAYLGRYDGRIAVAVLSNYRTVNAVSLGHQSAWLYLDTPPASAPDPVPTPIASVPVDVVARRAGVYLIPRTLEVIELTMKDGTLYTARQNGARLVPLDSTRFLIAGRTTQLVFEPREHSGYVALIPGRHPITVEWHAPVRPTRAALEMYAGTYHSEELSSTFRLTAGDSTLTLTTGTSPGLAARPVFADTFVSGQYTIQFLRRAGRVSGFEITHPRARRVRFVRVTRS